LPAEQPLKVSTSR